MLTYFMEIRWFFWWNLPFRNQNRSSVSCVVPKLLLSAGVNWLASVSEIAVEQGQRCKDLRNKASLMWHDELWPISIETSTASLFSPPLPLSPFSHLMSLQVFKSIGAVKVCLRTGKLCSFLTEVVVFAPDVWYVLKKNLDGSSGCWQVTPLSSFKGTLEILSWETIKVITHLHWLLHTSTFLQIKKPPKCPGAIYPSKCHHTTSVNSG